MQEVKNNQSFSIFLFLGGTTNSIEGVIEESNMS